ncbi:hypothetical protein, partial [Rhodopirellula bahusiensis]|uniref:hypothetical protein n=1 Tax=Rhodopirellula bahusiensis TaxID=2014065 RepID=UPI0032996221
RGKKNTEWTIQQIRDAVDAIVVSWSLPRESRRTLLEQVASRINYHQSRNAAARVSHTRRKLERYATLGIDPDTITRCRWAKT